MLQTKTDLPKRLPFRIKKNPTSGFPGFSVTKLNSAQLAAMLLLPFAAACAGVRRSLLISIAASALSRRPTAKPPIDDHSAYLSRDALAYHSLHVRVRRC